MENFDFNEKLNKLIKTDNIKNIELNFPMPLADPYLKFVNELIGIRVDWHRAFLRFIDCLEISVTFMSLIATATYLLQDTGRAKKADNVISQLRENSKLSTGYWWSLLRETLIALHDGDSNNCSQKLAKMYYSNKGKITDIAKMLDSIPNLRNKLKGHAYTFDDPNIYKNKLLEHLESMIGWYDTLKLFENFVLFSVKDKVSIDNIFKYEINLLTGTYGFYNKKIITSPVSLEINHLYISQSFGEEQRLNEKGLISLNPFIIIINNEANEPLDILLFQSYNGEKGISYISQRSGDNPVSQTEGLARFEKLIDMVSENKKEIKFPTTLYSFLSTSIEKAKQHTVDYINKCKIQRIYDEKLYLARQSLKNYVDNFIDSEKSILIIGGPSGIGKSCFLCKFSSELIDSNNSSNLFLLLSPDDFPENATSIEYVIRKVLNIEAGLKDWIVESKHLNNRFKWKFILLIDSIDKYLHPNRLLISINNFMEDFHSMEIFKIIATCNPNALGNLDDELKQMNLNSFYSPISKVLEDDRDKLPMVLLETFNFDELKEAFDLYKQKENYCPTTDFDSLNYEAKIAMSHPIFLRLVMEAYSGQQIPPHPISFQLLRKFCDPYIFKHRDRKEFIDNLVDMMLKLKQRSLSASQICSSRELREEFLSSHSDSPFQALLKDQILLITNRNKTEFPLNISEEYIEFSLDKVFQYFLILKAIDEYLDSPEQFIDKGLIELVRRSYDFISLRNGLLDLLADIQRNKRTADALKEQCIANIAQEYEQSDQQAKEWINKFLLDLLKELANDNIEDFNRSETKENEQEDITASIKVINILMNKNQELAVNLTFEIINFLFFKAAWQNAIKILEQLSNNKLLKVEDKFKIQNTLVVLLKNQDDWDGAGDYSRKNEVLIEILTKENRCKPEYIIRHNLNRFSVLYDQGERRAAIELCEKANLLAKENNFNLEQAATSNNLGIAYVYLDKPNEAEKILTEGIELNFNNQKVKGHLYLNRGLVRLFKWQYRGGNLADSESDIHKAGELFNNAEYIQGILYYNATVGLIKFYKVVENYHNLNNTKRDKINFTKDRMNELEEAGTKLEQGLEKAREINEVWPQYGILADLSIWWRKNHKPNLNESENNAQTAYDLAKDNKDPEGEAIIGMILARALMDKNEDIKDFNRIETILQASRSILDRLEFFSAARIACLGLKELYQTSEKKNKEVDDWIKEYDLILIKSKGFNKLPQSFEPLDWKLLFLVELF